MWREARRDETHRESVLMYEMYDCRLKYYVIIIFNIIQA